MYDLSILLFDLPIFEEEREFGEGRLHEIRTPRLRIILDALDELAIGLFAEMLDGFADERTGQSRRSCARWRVDRRLTRSEVAGDAMVIGRRIWIFDLQRNNSNMR